MLERPFELLQRYIKHLIMYHRADHDVGCTFFRNLLLPDECAPLLFAVLLSLPELLFPIGVLAAGSWYGVQVSSGTFVPDECTRLLVNGVRYYCPFRNFLIPDRCSAT
jgi:hypothetical protein